MNKRSIIRLLVTLGILASILVVIYSPTLPYIVARGVGNTFGYSSNSAVAIQQVHPTEQPTSLPYEAPNRSSLEKMSQAELATAHVPCELPQKERAMQEQCAALKDRLNEVRETAYPLTVEALRSLPTRTRSIPLGSPVPAGVIPDKYKVIEEIKDPQPGPSQITYASSVWRLGAVFGERDRYYLMFLSAMKPGDDKKPLIQRFFLDASDEVLLKWRAYWECPEPIGDITITGITGQTGIVSFTSTSGKSGTLDMASGAWSFK